MSTDSSAQTVYLYGADPVTCPRCGSRTDFREMEESDGRQQHVCLNRVCRFDFIAEPEDD